MLGKAFSKKSCQYPASIVESLLKQTTILILSNIHTSYLREDPPENHAILKFESTSTLSDFVYILHGVTY